MEKDYSRPADEVKLGTPCQVTQYYRVAEKKGKKEVRRTKRTRRSIPCCLRGSYTDGMLSLSLRDLDLQIDLRLDKVMELMMSAADANRAAAAIHEERYSDEELEAKWEELQSVELDEADSPSGYVLAAAWWIFPKGVDRDDLTKWFGERHSKGINYLMLEGA